MLGGSSVALDVSHCVHVIRANWLSGKGGMRCLPARGGGDGPGNGPAERRGPGNRGVGLQPGAGPRLRCISSPLPPFHCVRAWAGSWCPGASRVRRLRHGRWWRGVDGFPSASPRGMRIPSPCMHTVQYMPTGSTGSGDPVECFLKRGAPRDEAALSAVASAERATLLTLGSLGEARPGLDLSKPVAERRRGGRGPRPA